MRAMMLPKPGPVETSPLVLKDLPIPEPRAGEVLMRVETCGGCRTDLHVAEGELPPRRAELIPGHEVVGRIEKSGPGATRFRLGGRVGAAWVFASDGVCAYCLRGDENLCGIHSSPARQRTAAKRNT